MSEWKTCRLGDVAELVAGYAFKSKAFGNYADKVIKITDICESIRSSQLPGVSLENLNANRLNRYVVSRGDYVLAMTGSIGKIGRVVDGHAYINQRVLTIRPSHEVDKDFIYYILRTFRFYGYMITHVDSSSVQPNISANTIGQFEFSLPDLPTQRRIAAVLGALDDKIELNRKMNANLEAMAQALFKSWFVDFEPFGGQMPEGWKKGALGGVCKCILGGTPNRAKPEYWGGDVPWINSGMVNEFRIVTASEYITREGLEHSAAKMLPKKTAVLAITGATLGQYSLLEIDAAANQSVIGVVGNDELPYEYVYPFIAYSMPELLTHATGGAQQHINKQDVENLEVFIPPVEAMAKYRELVSPVFERIATTCLQSRTVAQLRDTLLPKLMSGELNVDDVKIEDDLRLSASPRESSASAGGVVSRGGAETRRGGVCT